MELRPWPFSFPSYKHICFSNSYNNKQRNHERAKAELILAHSVSHALWLVLCQCHHKFGSYNRRRCDVNQSKPWRQVLVNFYCPSLLPKLFVSEAHNQVKIAEWTGALSLNKKRKLRSLLLQVCLFTFQNQPSSTRLYLRGGTLKLLWDSQIGFEAVLVFFDARKMTRWSDSTASWKLLSSWEGKKWGLSSNRMILSTSQIQLYKNGENSIRSGLKQDKRIKSHNYGGCQNLRCFNCYVRPSLRITWHLGSRRANISQRLLFVKRRKRMIKFMVVEQM